MIGSKDRTRPSRVSMLPSTAACPLGQNVRAGISAIAMKNPKAMVDTILKTNALPSICGRVCAAPCLQTTGVDIQKLKQFSEQIVGMAKLIKIDDNAPTVAVIGSGPAGLAAAHRLIKLGVKPVVFEAADKAGGMLADVVPTFALPRETLAGDIANLEKIGVEIRRGVKVGKDVTWDEVEKSHAAVLVATGAGKGVLPAIPGIDLKGVTNAIDFCRAAENGTIKVSGKVVVQGGGITALQVARTAKRLGASDVFVVHPFPLVNWPVTSDAVETASKEGIELVPDSRVTEVWGYGKIEIVILRQVEVPKVDGVGRVTGGFQGKQKRLKASHLVAAVNRKPMEQLGLDDIVTGVFGNLQVDNGYKLGRPRWYAAGEAATGPYGILDSMVTGKLAAEAIKNDLEAK